MQAEDRRKLIAEIQVATLEGLRTVLLRIAQEEIPYSLEDLIDDVEMSISEIEENTF